MKVFLLFCPALANHIGNQVDAAAGDNGNVAAFNALCAVYLMAKEISEQKIPDKITGGTDKASVDEIKRLFVLTADDKYFEEGPKPPVEPQESTESRQTRLQTWKEEIKAMMDEKVLKDGKQVKKYVRPPGSPARVLANKKIGRIQTQAVDTVTRIKGVEESELRLRREARDLALAAMFGEGVQDADDAGTATFTSTYTNACGGALDANNAAAGKSLANDIVCLCVVQATGTSNQHACGSRFAAELNNKYYDNPTNGKQAWEILKGKCPHPGETSGNSQHEIASALAAFRALVGADPGTNGAIAGFEAILGGQRNAAGCDGNADNAKVCVNYGQHVIKGKGFGAIPWYDKMRKIILKQKELDSERSNLQVLQYQLAHLEELAHQAYLDAEYSSASAPSSEATKPEASLPVQSSEADTKAVRQGVRGPPAYAPPICVILGLLV
uniref:Variable surface glycoprotein n=1 Tax=Trypanosoma congolense TaxID=5692 RepID=Q01271_TRYCO|nr:variable surface glycoprotein [Trypanosoma congolense type Savannah]